MTVKCSTCGTSKFGLIRQRHYFLVFYSKRCAVLGVVVVKAEAQVA